jgi:hypothetical protein
MLQCNFLPSSYYITEANELSEPTRVTGDKTWQIPPLLFLVENASGKVKDHKGKSSLTWRTQKIWETKEEGTW